MATGDRFGHCPEGIKAQDGPSRGTGLRCLALAAEQQDLIDIPGVDPPVSQREVLL
jgi:hypothetical protein